VGEALVAGGGLTQPVFVSVRPRMTAHGGRSVSVLHLDEGEEADEEEPAWRASPDARSAPPLASLAPAERVAPAATYAVPPASAASSPPPEPVRPVPPAPSSVAFRPSDAVVAAPPQAPRRLPAVEAARREVRRNVWLDSDAREIHRVATRVGLVGPQQAPERTLQIVGDLETALHRDPDMRLRLLREIAENACFEVEPACIRCPLQNACQYHREIAGQRQKAGSPIRRLWRR
jgi:hypothetical protein